MFKILNLQIVILFSAVFAGLETAKSQNFDQTSCILSAYKAKRSQLTKFKLDLINNQTDINKIPIVARDFPRILAQQCPVSIDMSALNCPSKTVFRLFPNQFPAHLVEQECFCERCGPGVSEFNQNTACLPNIEFDAVLEFNVDKCVWEEKLRPRVFACQCTWTREISIF